MAFLKPASRPSLTQINRSSVDQRYNRAMEPHEEHQPGEPASRAGRYDELNVFGTPTGKVTHVREGEELPHSPRGFSWRYAAPEA